MSGKKNTNKKNNAAKTGTAAKNNAAKSTSSKSKSSVASKKKLTVAQRRELERQQRLTQLLVIVGSIVVTFVIVIICVLILENPSGNQSDYTVNDDSMSSTLGAGVYPASSDYEKAPDGEQLKKPSKGEEVAVLETSMGTIKIRLFPKYAPTAVENFKTLIKSGYYDGIIFHRVIDDFMIQSGDPTGTGMGGECAFDGYETFQDEFDRNLYNIRGAVSMANTGVDNTNGSQFFIVQTKNPTYSKLVNADGFKSNGGASWAAEAYEKYGGTAYLDGQFKSITGSGHTVFGQVYEGLNIVDKIAGVETDSSNKPLKDVTIKKAYLETVK
ncbi:MAG: peptidylprolyl isomerase [Acutalibacteraceae bacterium]